MSLPIVPVVAWSPGHATFVASWNMFGRCRGQETATQRAIPSGAGITIILLCLTGLSCDAIDWTRLRGASQSPEEVAIAFVTALSEHDVDAALNMFNAEIYDAISVEQVREIWPDLIANYGAFVEVGEVTVSHGEAGDFAIVPCEFEDETVRFQVTVDDDGKIAGFARQYGESDANAAN